MKVVCENCKTEFDKPNWLIKRSTHHFCSRKCGCARANEIRWKNHIKLSDKYKCNRCGKPRDCRSTGTICNNCRNQQSKEKGMLLTVGELKQKHNKRHGRWYSAEIRSFARSWNPELVNFPCQKCGYSLHTEICHIKPITSFPDNATLGEVNNENNLLVLCPNDHWEFDAGLLKLENIPSRKVVALEGVEPSF